MTFLTQTGYVVHLFMEVKTTAATTVIKKVLTNASHKKSHQCD
jgi:hypothetical protein